MKITIKIEAPERSRGYERTFETEYVGYTERLKEALNVVVDWYEMLAEKELLSQKNRRAWLSENGNVQSTVRAYSTGTPYSRFCKLCKDPNKNEPDGHWDCEWLWFKDIKEQMEAEAYYTRKMK